jgi:hypothetical protein
MSGSCNLEIKTLKGEKVVLEGVDLEDSVETLYHKVQQIETAPDGKWKLMIVVKSSARTLKWSDKEKPLREYGVEANQQYRVEVILDMGACHTICRR